MLARKVALDAVVMRPVSVSSALTGSGTGISSREGAVRRSGRASGQDEENDR
ncbi:hypothetical protein AAE021_14555 [Arthrobacter citreus]|uniref:Uncharacterized protein n=1 Tax=Arthrobacter citreus TaxID=1670 RepID=A0ABZ3A100_9MICC